MDDGPSSETSLENDEQSHELDDNQTRQFVTFQLENEYFGFPLDCVLEITRVPKTVIVPMAPRSLVGLANLRGSILPILDLRTILMMEKKDYTDATRILVADVGTPVGLVVDRVARVLQVDLDKIESADEVQSSIKTELLTGVVKNVDAQELIQLLDVFRCIRLDFKEIIKTDLLAAQESAGTLSSRTGTDAVDTQDEESLQIVSFLVDGQEYGFLIDVVEEIVRVPEGISRVPRADQSVIGIISLRDRLLPLVGMRRIFDLEEKGLGEQDRIVVVSLRSADSSVSESVGIVVDQVRAVIRIERDCQGPMPHLLTKRGDEEEIICVCRLENGKRLISVLNASALFDNDVVKSAITTAKEGAESKDIQEQDVLQDSDEEIKLVVFQLGNQEFGVLVESVQEIIRVPEQMSRVPKSEECIEGMVNLRGSVLPVMDMRRRFGLQRIDRNDRQRILVLNQEGACNGFVVDSVSEVLGVSGCVIEESPKLSAEQTRIMGKVANIKDQQRMIQILNAQELLGFEESQTLLKASA